MRLLNLELHKLEPLDCNNDFICGRPFVPFLCMLAMFFHSSEDALFEQYQLCTCSLVPQGLMPMELFQSIRIYLNSRMLDGLPELSTLC